MAIDPELMLSKLETAITSSNDDKVRSTLCQVKLAITLPTNTTDELIAAMAKPMRDREKEHKVTQEKGIKAEQQRVNALHAQRGGGRGQGGKGGGRGAKGGNKSKGPCLKFAEGNCTKGDRRWYKHVALGNKEIAELKATLAAKATTNQRKKGHTATQVVNALQTSQPGTGTTKKLTLAEKMEELRTDGLSDEQIIKVATLLLENK